MLITVFTPTYNRAKTIIRTYESLKRQSFKDFEWLIIDDGSTDDTREVVEGFIANNDISIMYIVKANGGKHTAYNLALDEARGELFFTVDSDDWLTDNALKDISDLSGDLNDNSIAGIVGLKAFPDGALIGKKFLRDNFLSSFRGLELSGQAGERSIIIKTKIARLFRFPVIEGERFITEATVYDKYNDEYTFVCSNHCFTVCEYQADGLSSNPRRLMVNNPGGYMIFYRNRIDMACTFSERVGYILRYNFFKSLYKKGDIQNYDGRCKTLCIFLSVLNPLVNYYYKTHLN